MGPVGVIEHVDKRRALRITAPRELPRKLVPPARTLRLAGPGRRKAIAQGSDHTTTADVVVGVTERRSRLHVPIRRSVRFSSGILQRVIARRARVITEVVPELVAASVLLA